MKIHFFVKDKSVKIGKIFQNYQITKLLTYLVETMKMLRI